MSTANSHAMMIRDEMLKRIKTFPIFASVPRFGKSPMLTVQSEDIPYLGVYLVEEQLTVDGDANAGEPRFQSRAKIGFQYVIQNNDPDAAEDKLDLGYWAILTNFFEVQRWDYLANDTVWIEGVERGSRSHHYGNAGNDNRTPYAELRADLTFMQREFFPPPVTDVLKSIHVTVADHVPYDPEKNAPLRVIILDLDVVAGTLAAKEARDRILFQ
jgi:hypothetical protein